MNQLRLIEDHRSIGKRLFDAGYSHHPVSGSLEHLICDPDGKTVGFMSAGRAAKFLKEIGA